MMTLKMVILRKLHATSNAFMRLSSTVGSRMPAQKAALGEPFLTDVASEWLLPRMRLRVSSKHRNVLEASFADVANERSFNGVNDFVPRKTLLNYKPLVPNLAKMCFLIASVRISMSPQRR